MATLTTTTAAPDPNDDDDDEDRDLRRRIMAMEARLQSLHAFVKSMYPHLYHPIGGPADGLLYVGLASGNTTADGTISAAPSYTYTVTDASGATLGTTVSPAIRLYQKGRFEPATKGIAYYHSGSLVLLLALEKRRQGAC